MAVVSTLTAKKRSQTSSVTPTRLSQMKSAAASLQHDLAHNADFRREWERTALARAVALVLLRYRQSKHLTQAELAHRLGIAQPQVARLEGAEITPSLETIFRIADALNSEFLVSIRPQHRPRRWTTKDAERADVVTEYKTKGSRVLIAAG